MKRYIVNLLIAVDQLFNAVGGGDCDESISARCWRRGYTLRVRIIDWFFYPGHCRDAYISEKTGQHLDQEYRL